MVNSGLNRYLKWVPRLFIITNLLSLASAFCVVLEYWGIAHIVHDIFILKMKIEDVKVWFILALAALLFRTIFEYVAEEMALRLSLMVRKELRKQMVQTILENSPLMTQLVSVGHLMGVFLDGIDTLDRYYRNYLPQLVKSLLLPVIFLIFVFPKDWISGVILLITLPMIPFFMILIGRWSRRVSEKQWQLLNQLASYLQDVLRGLETLKILGRSKEQGTKINKISESFRLTTLRVQRWAFISSLSLELLSTISIALVAVGLGLRLVAGEISYLPAFFVLLIAPEYYKPMRELGSFFHASMDADAVANDLFYWIDHEKEKKKENQLEEFTFSNLRFEQVSYTYPDCSEPVLKEISFTWNKGESIALVGESGSGKTTLLYLALGFLKPTSGCIYLNDKPLEQQLSSWQSAYSFLPQESVVFNGTIAENITSLENCDVDFSAVKQAAEASGLTSVLDDDEQSLAQLVGQGHNPLSGGQRALLGLARAFYDRKAILLMDEPTDNLDLQSEKKVMESLQELMPAKTVFTIAHRLHTVMKANRIFLIESGRILAVGDYDFLCKKSHKFREFLRRETND